MILDFAAQCKVNDVHAYASVYLICKYVSADKNNVYIYADIPFHYIT